MFVQFVIGVTGMMALIALWVAVQAVMRRRSSQFGPDDDVLRCGLCAAGGHCFCHRGRDADHDAEEER